MAGEYDVFTGVFEPIRIHYEGMDAAGHQMELLSLGQSLQGAARLFGVAGNFAFTGKYVRKQPALSVRVLALPPRPSSYEVFALIASIHGALPLTPQELTKYAETIIKYVLSKLTSKSPSESAMALDLAKTAITEMGMTTRAQADVTAKAIDALADAQRLNARLLVAPIGQTCDTITIGDQSRQPLLLDRAAKEAIDAPAPVEMLNEKNYDVKITEIDIKRHTCKLSLPTDDDPEQRYDAEILDPVIDQPNDPYSTAVTNKLPVRVRAKVEIKEGDFRKFFISGIQDAAA